MLSYTTFGILNVVRSLVLYFCNRTRCNVKIRSRGEYRGVFSIRQYMDGSTEKSTVGLG